MTTTERALATTAGDLAELVRLPAVATVPGDAWAGSASVGAARLGPATASALLYLGGMALNDWADREVDADERPERPIPSGRVTPSTALAVAGGLLAGGVAVALRVGGRRSAGIGTAIAGAVAAYDLVAKDTPAGPPAMAVCRGLDVLLGAAAGPADAALSAAAVPAVAVAAQTFGVTQLSRHEVHGAASSAPARTALGASLLAAGLAAGSASEESDRSDRLLAAVAAVAFAIRAGGAAHRAAGQHDDADAVRAAVGAGLGALPLLQAALLVGRGARGRALVVALATPAVRALSRWRAIT